MVSDFAYVGNYKRPAGMGRSRMDAWVTAVVVLAWCDLRRVGTWLNQGFDQALSKFRPDFLAWRSPTNLMWTWQMSFKLCLLINQWNLLISTLDFIKPFVMSHEARMPHCCLSWVSVPHSKSTLCLSSSKHAKGPTMSYFKQKVKNWIFFRRRP